MKRLSRDGLTALMGQDTNSAKKNAADHSGVLSR